VYGDFLRELLADRLDSKVQDEGESKRSLNIISLHRSKTCNYTQSVLLDLLCLRIPKDQR
jgi:hypothetical protein